MTQSYENVQLALGQKWLNEYCGDIPGYIPVPETGGYGTVGKTIIGVLTALQKNIGVSIGAISQEYANTSHLFGDSTKEMFGDYNLSVNSDFSNEYNLNMLKVLQLGLWCKGKDPGAFGVATPQLTTAINAIMAEAGILSSQQDGVASRMIFIAVSTEVDFVIPAGSNGNPRTRQIQQTINAAYGEERGFLVPCDGIKAVSTIAGFLYYYQRTIGLTKEEATNAYGLYNTQTYELSPTLELGSTNFLMVTILQNALYLINGYDSPSNGVFDSATESIVEELQLSVGLPMNGIVDKLTWGYVLESCGYQDVPATVCDTSMILAESDIQILKNNNISMVGRYLTGAFAMTPEEIKMLTSSNIAVIPIFEYGNELSYFTFEQGQSDALSAVLAAERLGIPADNGVTIYFAVDNDFTLNDLEAGITDYFSGIFAKIIQAGLGYNVGIYGARYACTYMLNKGYVSNSYVASSSYEFQLNMGYPMPCRWAFNQYSTMNINSEGIPSPIFLGGCIPIDKVKSSGYDKGVIQISQNGITTTVVTPSTELNNNVTYLNEKHAPTLNEIAKNIINKVLNIKTPNLWDFPGPIRDKILDWRLPLGENMYLRVDYGLKEQSGSGSMGTLYFNNSKDSWVPEISMDCLPKGFMGGNVGANINPSILKSMNFSKIFKSIIPTYAYSTDTYNIAGEDISGGVQIYGCWDGNRGAKSGYWEVGAEFGLNVGGGKLADVPSTFYFYFDIIVGIRDTMLEKVLGDIDNKIEATFESVTNFITKVAKNIIKGNPTLEESAGEAELEFESGTPELFEAADAVEAAETAAETAAEWDAFIEILEPIGFIAMCCC